MKIIDLGSHGRPQRRASAQRDQGWIDRSVRICRRELTWALRILRISWRFSLAKLHASPEEQQAPSSSSTPVRGPTAWAGAGGEREPEPRLRGEAHVLAPGGAVPETAGGSWADLDRLSAFSVKVYFGR